MSDLKTAVSALQQQMAAMAMGQQAAFFGQQQPPTTIHVAKKRKSPRDSVTDQMWAHTQPGGAPTMEWAVPPAWQAPPPPQQQILPQQWGQQ